MSRISIDPELDGGNPPHRTDLLRREAAPLAEPCPNKRVAGHQARQINKQLLLDSRAYACERPLTSWWALLSTLGLFVGLQAVAAVDGFPLFVRLAASIIAGLTIVRLFILYHDHQHGTILKKSRLVRAFMLLYGLLTLNPPSIWKRSHDHHHRHNSKLMGASIGSFPVMTVSRYRTATRGERLAYAATRHPLTFLFAYGTVFLYGMCIRSLIVNPRLHIDSGLAILTHFGVAVVLGLAGWDLLLLCLVLPSAIAATAGAYLFYAQHNFPGTRFFESAARWDYVSAALNSSSYMPMGPVLAWFTGNIGYHHVHHVNHHIPFYRLPEAMAGMPALHNPKSTSLSLRDIRACLGLKLWDEERQEMVPWPGGLW